MDVLAADTLGCGATKVSELLLPHLTNNNDISKKTAEINKFAFFENTDNEQLVMNDKEFYKNVCYNRLYLLQQNKTLDCAIYCTNARNIGQV